MDKLTEAFFSRKKTMSEKIKAKHKIQDYAPIDKRDEQLGLGSFDELDTSEINKRLVKSLGASLSNNTIRAKSRSATKSFPIIVSDAIDPSIVETLRMIYENQYADYLSLFIENQIVDLGDYSNDDSETIAIQIINNLIDSENRKNLLQKLADKGKLSIGDILGPAGKLLGFNEDMKTGSEFLDSLLEDAIICNREDAELVENMIMLESENIEDETNPKHIINEDLTNYQKLIIPDVEVQKYLSHTMKDELDNNPALKEDFKIAINLLGGRKISGSEFLAYCYYVNISVPTSVRTNLLLKFQMGDVINPTNPNLTIDAVHTNNIKHNLVPSGKDMDSLVDSLLFGRKHMQAMYLNKRVVMGAVDEILSVKVKDFLYSYLVKRSKNRKLGAATLGGVGALAAIPAAILASPTIAVALSLGGFGAAAYGLIGLITGAKKREKKAEDKIEDVEKSFSQDVENILSKHVMEPDNVYDSKTVRKYRKTIAKAYDAYAKKYLRLLKQTNDPKYDKVVNSPGGEKSFKKNIPLDIEGNLINVSIGDNLKKDGISYGISSGKTEYNLADMENPASRVITLIQLYKSQREVKTNTVTDFEKIFKDKFNNVYDPETMNNDLYKTITTQLETISTNTNSDIIDDFNNYLTDLKPEFNKAADEYSKEYDRVGNRQVMRHESADASGDDYKIIDIPDFLLDDEFEVSEEIVNEAYESGDDMLMFISEHMSIAEKKAQQEEIDKILTAIPMKKYEYDAIRGKTMYTPAFVSGGEKVYGSVEYDPREREKRKYGAPLMLKISFKRRFADDKTTDGELTAFIGVRGEVITIPSDEMTQVLKENNDGNVVYRAFDSKTGFENIGNVFKNFKLNKDIDKLPVSSDVWKNLSKFSLNNAINALAGKKHGNVANAHFLFSDSEISELRNEHDVDYYRNVKLAKAFMDRYGASTISIVNETTERMHVLDSPDVVSWNVVPLSSIRGAQTADGVVAALSALQGRRI